MRRCAYPGCVAAVGPLNRFGVCVGCSTGIAYYPDRDAYYDELYPAATTVREDRHEMRD